MRMANLRKVRLKLNGKPVLSELNGISKVDGEVYPDLSCLMRFFTQTYYVLYVILVINASILIRIQYITYGIRNKKF